MMTSCKREQ